MLSLSLIVFLCISFLIVVDTVLESADAVIWPAPTLTIPVVLPITPYFEPVSADCGDVAIFVFCLRWCSWTCTFRLAIVSTMLGAAEPF